jgi:glycosyltransferase involved in cell wall biosynthesis
MQKMYPKTLIIGEVFKNSTGGGITLLNLFHDWPAENLAVLSERCHEANVGICHNYYQLGRNEIVYSRLMRKRVYQRESGSYSITALDVKNENTNLKSKDTDKRKSKIIKTLLNYSGFLPFFRSLHLTDELICWIDDYAPDLIYCQIFSLQSIQLVELIRQKTKLPILIHIMDDFINAATPPSLLYYYWKHKLNVSFIRLLEKTSVCLCISDGMAIEYEKRYGRKFYPVHNPVDVDFWIRKNCTDIKPKLTGANFKILYSGKISNGCINALLTFSDAIFLLRKKGIEVNLHISSNFDSYPKLIETFTNKGVVIEPYVQYAKLPDKLRKFDLLLIPYDIKGKHYKRYLLSMPTKMTEYMATGVPVLVFAPEKSAIVLYAKKRNVSFTFTNDNIEKLASYLNEIIFNHSDRKTISSNAIDLVLASHSTSTVRAGFLKHLSDAVV